MDMTISEAIPAPDDEFKLGAMMGRREAFGIIAGRCSAAEANCLRRIREEKLYKTKAGDWRTFCRVHLGLSRSLADKIIRLLDEFGPDYFEVAQLARISAESFRQIASCVKDKALHVNGEAIVLIPENA